MLGSNRVILTLWRRRSFLKLPHKPIPLLKAEMDAISCHPDPPSALKDLLPYLPFPSIGAALQGMPRSTSYTLVSNAEFASGMKELNLQG